MRRKWGIPYFRELRRQPGWAPGCAGEREWERVTRCQVSLTRPSANPARQVAGEHIGLVGQGQCALHVAGIQGLLGLGQEALNRLVAFLLLPSEALRVDLTQQALRAVDAVLRVSLKLPLLLRTDLGREHGRRRRRRGLHRRRRGWGR